MEVIERRFLVLAGALLVTATASSAPVEAIPDAGMALLIGTDTATTRVLFRTLDRGPMLWIEPGKLGSQLSVQPGHHRLHVTCEFTADGNTLVTAGTIEFDAVASRVYDVDALSNPGERRCDLTVTIRD